MAVAAVLVVAIFAGDLFARLAPVRLPGMPVAHVADQPIDNGVLRNETNRAVDELVDLRLHKGLRLHGSQHLGPVDCFAVVAHAGGAAGQVGGQRRVARGHHGPAVNEDLGTDLFGHDFAVGGDRPALGRDHPVFEA